MEDTWVISDTQRLKESLGQLPDPIVQPVFIVVSGLPGTGKSYFCDKLAERLPIIILKSDALRKVLFSSPAYSPQESSRLFQAIHHLIGELLKKATSLNKEPGYNPSIDFLLKIGQNYNLSGYQKQLISDKVIPYMH